MHPAAAPANARSAIPYIVCKGAEDALAFYVEAFGATEDFRMTDPATGKLGHAELSLGEAKLYVADEWPDFGAISPDTLGGTAVSIVLATEDCDALAAQAKAAGAAILREPADQSFGERTATLQCPWGHRWMLQQKIEEMTGAEMQRRWEEETSA